MSDITDISYWQGLPYSVSPNDSGIDYDKLAAKSPGGVILRASSGSYKDLRFEQNYAELHARGVPLAAYHFFKPVAPTAIQIQVFDQARGDKEFTFPHFEWVLDVEASASGWSQAKYRAEVQLMVDAVGFDCIYTRASFWDPALGNWWPEGARAWLAHYGAAQPNEPQASPEYTLHQYSADGNGKGAEYGVLSSAIDLNRLNPALVTDPPPDPQPAPMFEPIVLVAQVDGQNVRSGPGTQYPKIDTLDKGDLVRLYELDVQTGSKIWARIAHDSDEWAAVVYPTWTAPAGRVFLK